MFLVGDGVVLLPPVPVFSHLQAQNPKAVQDPQELPAWQQMQQLIKVASAEQIEFPGRQVQLDANVLLLTWALDKKLPAKRIIRKRYFIVHKLKMNVEFLNSQFNAASYLAVLRAKLSEIIQALQRRTVHAYSRDSRIIYTD
jgi:hypothetical protein